jgi:hypothetical protein
MLIIKLHSRVMVLWHQNPLVDSNRCSFCVGGVADTGSVSCCPFAKVLCFKLGGGRDRFLAVF